MKYPSKNNINIKAIQKLDEAVKDESFVRQALVVTCMSILLELFGHTFISVITGIGYSLYAIK
jgi:hypothetical protein